MHRVSLSPQGAGDLIDRAVRLYRRHFITLIRTAAPPVCVSTLGAVLWTVGIRATWQTMSSVWLVLYVLMAIAGVGLMIGGYLLYLIVMGGASRNLVAHLLYDEEVSARTIYRNVRARFWGLVLASVIVACALAVASGIAAMVFYIGAIAAVLIGLGAAQFGVYWVSGVIGALVIVAAVIGALWVFFFLAARVAYVPQVMLVEGRNPFMALARSATLASGGTWRLMAMFSFTTFATYSALAALLIPLAWYGYLNGVEPWAWNAAEWPLWYSVGNQVVWNVSSILLAPVWMLGLSLLYVDERVRREGYDIELHAARVFGDQPLMPHGNYKGALSPEDASGAGNTAVSGVNNTLHLTQPRVAEHRPFANQHIANAMQEVAKVSSVGATATDQMVATTNIALATDTPAVIETATYNETAANDMTANDAAVHKPDADDRMTDKPLDERSDKQIDIRDGRPNASLLTCLLAILFALAFAPRVCAATLEDYRARVRAGHVAVESLIAAEADEDQTSEEYMRLEERTFSNLRQLLPARETVEWNNTKIEIDNEWLHEWMKLHADETFEDHTVSTLR